MYAGASGTSLYNIATNGACFSDWSVDILIIGGISYLLALAMLIIFDKSFQSALCRLCCLFSEKIVRGTLRKLGRSFSIVTLHHLIGTWRLLRLLASPFERCVASDT